jgi:hypothetical protein
MLSVTGTFKGEPVEDKIVPAKDLIEYFGLPINPGKQTRVQFELDPRSKGVITKNLADGEERYSPRGMMKPLINGSFKGDTIEIRYYERKSQRGKNTTYSPSRVHFTGKRMGLDVEQNLEQAVFFLLHPWCVDSPVRRRNSIGRYRIYSAEAAGKAKIAEVEKFSMVRDMILKATDEQALRVAKAISYKSQHIAKDETDFPSTAKAALLILAQKQPGVVQSAFSSPEMEVIGAAMQAQDDGVIEMSPNKMGRNAWFYANGSEIVSVPKGKPVFNELVKHLQNPGEFERFIANAYPDEANSRPDEAPAEIDFDDYAAVLQEGINQGFVKIHPTEDKVYIMVDNQFQDRALKVVDDRDNWQEELIANATKAQANRVKKLIEK